MKKCFCFWLFSCANLALLPNIARCKFRFPETSQLGEDNATALVHGQTNGHAQVSLQWTDFLAINNLTLAVNDSLMVYITYEISTLRLMGYNKKSYDMPKK